MAQEIDFSNDSWLDMANGALAMISSDLLQTLGDTGSAESNYIQVLLPKALEQVYSILPLDDISEWKELPRSTTNAQIGSDYKYAYDLPVKCASVREVNITGDMDYQIIRNAILTDANAVSIRFISLPATPSEMPYYAKSLMMTLLASLLAGPISHDASLATALKNEYQSQLSMCLSFRKLTKKSNNYSIESTKEWFN